MTSFFSFVGIPAPPRAPRLGLLRRDVVGKEEEKETYPPAGFSLQDFPYRDNYPCKSFPVGKYLQERFTSSEAFKPACIMWGGGCSASTSSRRAEG